MISSTSDDQGLNAAPYLIEDHIKERLVFKLIYL